MTKNPADFDREMISRAVRFEATIFLGVGKYHTAAFDSLADARDAARQFGGVVKNGRKGMVYAVTAEGRSTLVPDSYEHEGLIEGETTMPTTNLSGTDIAKLTAIMTGGDFKRANSKEAAIKRYLNVAAEKGIQNAERYLGAEFDFDTAQHCLFEAIKGGYASIPEVKAASKPASEAEPKAERPVKADKPLGKRAAILAAAEAGELPAAPDFSAETHKRFRPKLAEVVSLAEKGDLKGLKAFEINPVSSSPKAIMRYRDLCIIALEAQDAAKGGDAK